ncbi:MAG TPA: hypothetical protein VH763_11775 [Gemmatimonadales bacterium]|jgi:hypothetical protein
MARLFWLVCMLALACAIVVGASWAAAYTSVGQLLGAPPPQMGTQSTTLLWRGARQFPGHPRAWLFAFGPTLIPGAPNVQIYVTPTGQIMRTYPADLESRIRAFHNTGY